MTRIADLKKRWMADPEFRKEYAKADEEFALIEALIRARTGANLSQAALAERIGTTQSAIARLEGGGVSPSLSTLRRYAEATGTRLHLELRADRPSRRAAPAKARSAAR
jgi:transcriptional regulator with XRE-family HTH domain